MKKIDWYIVIPLLVFIAIVAHMLTRSPSANSSKTLQQAGSHSETSTPESVREGQIQAIQQMNPGIAEELLNIPEGNVEQLKAAYKKHTGFHIKEIRKNPDGTYDAVLSKGEEVRLKQAQVIADPKEQEEFRENYLKAANGGKEPILDKRDHEEILKFRQELNS